MVSGHKEANRKVGIFEEETDRLSFLTVFNFTILSFDVCNLRKNKCKQTTANRKVEMGL